MDKNNRIFKMELSSLRKEPPITQVDCDQCNTHNTYIRKGDNTARSKEELIQYNLQSQKHIGVIPLYSSVRKS